MPGNGRQANGKSRTFGGHFKKERSLPPRWKTCPRRGQLVADLFLPFKTPLDDNFKDMLQPHELFTPQMVLECGLKLGLWVDLTKTTRFYDASVVEDAGVRYSKLQCKGHQEAPPKETVDHFIRLCKANYDRDPSAKIAVHCTHGFNRTGFLICCFLVEVADWAVQEAVSVFAQLRPPGIYKHHYLQELFARYDLIENTPPAPDLPEWDNGEEEEDVDPAGDDTGRGPPSRKRARQEINKQNAEFFPGIHTVEQVTDMRLVTEVRDTIQRICRWNRSGFPGLQPVSLDRRNLLAMREKHFKVSWKADGTRYMLLIDGPTRTFFIDRDNTVFQAPQFKFFKRKSPEEALANTLVDGEVVKDEVDGRPIIRYLAYDIVQFNGEPVGQMNYDIRLLCLEKEIVTPRYEAIKEGRIDKMSEPFSIRVKPFWDITTTEKLLSETGRFSKEVSHEIDGLVFQEFAAPYVGGSNPAVLKWKPPSLNTIDFRLQFFPETRPGMLAKRRAFLFVGGHDRPFGELQPCKEAASLDGCIVECSYEPCAKHPEALWKFLRQRTDKSIPNHVSTAEAVWNSIKEPVTKDYLLKFITDFARKPKGSQTNPPSKH